MPARICIEVWGEEEGSTQGITIMQGPTIYRLSRTDTQSFMIYPEYPLTISVVGHGQQEN